MSVHFVHRNQHRFATVTEPRCSFAVERHDAFLDDYDEDDDIRGFNRDLHLFESGANDDVVRLFAPEQTDATGVHQGEGLAAPFSLGRNAITGHAGLIMNDGDTPSDDAVEERGFPDVWPAHDGN